MSDLNATVKFSFSKGILSPYTIGDDFDFNIAGEYAIKKNLLISGATTLDLGAISTLGLIGLTNATSAAVPPAPVPVITQAGTPGTTVVEYAVVAHFADGSVSVGLGSTATAAASLNGTNYNIVTWASVGATTYDLYRILTDGVPSTLGLIASGVTSPHNDQGAAGDGAATPSGVVSPYELQFGEDGSSWPIALWGGESGVIRWREAAIHVQPTNLPAELEYLLIEQ